MTIDDLPLNVTGRSVAGSNRGPRRTHREVNAADGERPVAVLIRQAYSDARSAGAHANDFPEGAIQERRRAIDRVGRRTGRRGEHARGPRRDPAVAWERRGLRVGACRNQSRSEDQCWSVASGHGQARSG